MGWDEFLEWIAFDRIDPFTGREYRAEVRAGVIASTVANANLGKNQKLVTIEDCMPFYQKPKPEPVKLPDGWAPMYE